MLPRLTNWLRNSRKIRRCLYGLACFAFLIALFYAEEDWRGKRAWENYKREWEAKGERFDFASFVPPAVPDDQNFALTPIVASSYSAFLDRQGHPIRPPNTNVVNRLDFTLDMPDEQNAASNNYFLGDWRLGIKADLEYFQKYYRAPVNTNRHPRYRFYDGGIEAKLPPNALNGFPKTLQPQLPAADVLLALSKETASIEELRQAARLPYSRFPLDYYANPYISSQSLELSPLDKCVEVLRIRAIAELENGQNNRALDDVKLILCAANSVRNQSYWSWKATYFIDCALQPLWEGLVDRKWSDAQLAEFEQESAKFDMLSDYRFSIRIKRVWAIGEVDYCERRRSLHEICAAFGDPAEETFESGWDRCLEATEVWLMPKGWFFQNDLAIARTIQQSLQTDVELRRGVFPHESEERYERALSISHQQLPPGNFFGSFFIIGSPLLMKGFAFAQSSIDRARVACALERYRLAHGEYPETLERLSPQYINELPHDLINDKPLHYRRTDDGQFLLYSVGWNEKDDGGIIVRTGSRSDAFLDKEEGDWVWPCRPVPLAPVRERQIRPIGRRSFNQ